MDNESNTLTLTGGMDVVGSDGEKVGDVADMQGDFVVVSKGWFFPTDYYIPTSAITTVDDKVHLNVTKDEALNQGWDVVPDTITTTSVFEEQPIVDPGLHIDNPVNTYDTADDDEVYITDTVDSNNSDTINVALTEEELTARTRGVERGSVQVDKIVTEEEQALDVPVTQERVHVTRRIVDREVTPGDATFEEGTIDVPVYGEEVEVEKRARVREEIEISKDVTTKTERVSDTVRREDVRVTDDSGTIVDDDSTPQR